MNEAGTHRRIYRLPNSPTVVNVRAPFYLDDKRMFDDGDLLIATFEKTEEGPSIVRLLNSAETLLEAAKDAVSSQNQLPIVPDTQQRRVVIITIMGGWMRSTIVGVYASRTVTVNIVP